MITGLPDYRPPVEQSLRCLCGLRYIVFLGGTQVDDLAVSVARERAGEMHAQFVDARSHPWIDCDSCGLLLDFTSSDAAELVM